MCWCHYPLTVCHIEQDHLALHAGSSLSSHALVFACPHLRMPSSSHALIFTCPHLHMPSSPHALIFACPHRTIAVTTWLQHWLASLTRTQTQNCITTIIAYSITKLFFAWCYTGSDNHLLCLGSYKWIRAVPLPGIALNKNSSFYYLLVQMNGTSELKNISFGNIFLTLHQLFLRKFGA